MYQEHVAPTCVAISSLKLIVSHHTTSEPCGVWRRPTGHPGEGGNLELIRSGSVCFLKSLFHLETVALVISYESSHQGL